MTLWKTSDMPTENSSGIRNEKNPPVTAKTVIVAAL